MAADGGSAACDVMAEAREAAVRLLSLLQATGADPGKQELARQIICSIDRARTSLRGAGGDSKGKSEQWFSARAPAGSKRRARGGEARARVMSSGMDDGYAWRKYGEKSIQDHRNPRFYFRCAYKGELGCGARKQVERAEDDPSLFHVTYFGDHTPACPRDDAAAAAAEVDGESRFVLQQTSLVGFRPAAECWPVKDQVANLVSSISSADVSFASPGGTMESLDASLEELMELLRS
ncbi:unnamed protein product [Urochloa decumbens]|uniref:WRKY domain-containing protein n=1 Tax=Urochloa decumbens TaxID=240449 RepID=A0ABC8W1S4_9POAL